MNRLSISIPSRPSAPASPAAPRMLTAVEV